MTHKTPEYKNIDPAGYRQLAAEQAVTLVDIRDPQSFHAGHMEGAVHIESLDLENFVETAPKHQPLVICCYHGISSQSAAAYFAEKGFSEVYSLDGGYQGWCQAFPS